MYFCMMKEYKTIAHLSTAEYKDRGSRFLSYAISVQTEREVYDFLESLKKKHPRARHICYAYTIGFEKPVQRLNDDGEPTHTAAKPIMNFICKYEVDNVIVAVVRYFGGVLLGKGGLIRAYGTTADMALAKADIVKIQPKAELQFIVEMKHYPVFMDQLRKYDVEILHQEFGELCHISISVVTALIPQLKKILSDFIHT